MIDNSIVRQVNIDLITGDHNPIIEWFNDLWTKLYIIEAEVYHNDGTEFIYYKIDGNNNNKWIFYQDIKKNKFWCNYKNYWSFFDVNYDIKYSDIQIITKLLVENSLNNNVGTPNFDQHLLASRVENALNNAVIAKPHAHNQEILHTINVVIPTPDFASNNTVATPFTGMDINSTRVENALNNTKNNE